MGNNKANIEEDLAIQETLAMTVEERLVFLANLISDKITEDQKPGELLMQKITELKNG